MSSYPVSKINFFFDNVVFALKNRKHLKDTIYSIFKNEKKDLESLNYIFCSDRALLKINQEFLEHDYLTDIITFPFSKKGRPIVSEVYISVDRVRNNSVSHETSFEKELLRVIFHGALHLCGHKDKTEREKKKMRLREDFYINNYLINVSRDT